jgi:hypothetical protein
VSQQHIEVRELAAWGYDPQPGRGSLASEQLEDAAREAQRRLAMREPYEAESPVSVEECGFPACALEERRKPVADSGEFDALNWRLAVVDLRKLIAFQRRVGFARGDGFQTGPMNSWRNLLDVALPATHAPASHEFSAAPDGKSLTIRTLSPNLAIRFAWEAGSGLESVRLVAQVGSPYIEAASYRGRWFLRDGYHRAFLLLKQGIFHIPAVVVCAETLFELGAVGQWFFAEDVLFSALPPMLTDFLDDKMVVRFSRPRAEKLVQVSIQELREPARTGCMEGGNP